MSAVLPACFGSGRAGLRDRDVFKLAGGYASHLLTGVWATATCLHNDSVLTLYLPYATGSKIELDQSEAALSSPSGTAEVHRIVPVG